MPSTPGLEGEPPKSNPNNLQGAGVSPSGRAPAAHTLGTLDPATVGNTTGPRIKEKQGKKQEENVGPKMGAYKLPFAVIFSVSGFASYRTLK